MGDPLNWANANVRDLKPYQPGKPIESLAKEYGLKNIIKLASNENPLGTSPWVLDKLKQSPWALQLYPEGGGVELKAALSEFWGIQANQFTLGAGSEELIRFIIQTFVNQKQSILIPEYSFIAYEIVAKALGVGVKKVPLDRWRVNVKALVEACQEEIKVIFIANPGNPIGHAIDRDEFQYLMQHVPDHVLVVMDEAYYEYSVSETYPNTVDALAKYPNLIVTRTFSKAYGLAGLRVGYGMSHPEVADLLNRIRGPFNITSMGLEAARWALEDQNHVRESIALNQKGLKQLTDFAQQLSIPVISFGGNFLTFDVGKNAQAMYHELLHQGIIVRPLVPYQLDTFLRVTIGTESQNQRFMEAFQKLSHPC